MAKWNHSDPKQATEVTIQKGDTLWAIAIAKYGSGIKYKQIAALNNLSNPNLVAIGTTLKLDNSGSSGSGGSGGSSSSTTTNTTNSNKPTIDQFGLLPNVDNTLFATWTWNKSNTESYKVLWTYDTGNGVWLVGNNGTITVDKDSPNISKQSTYTIPSGARKVQFKVKPISEKKMVNNKETSYWTAEWSTVKTYTDDTPLKTPGSPSVSIEKYKLTTILEGIDFDAEGIEFEIVKDNEKTFNTGKAKIVTERASYSCTVDSGSEYKVRCRAYKGSEKSDWSGYSENASTIPATPSGITTIRANDETSVYLEWAAEKTAKTYDIEYTTKKIYFDGSDQTVTKSGIESTHFIITGLESGEEYFFRLRAVNDKGDESAWSEIKSVVVGETPAAPTTWSSTTTAITGEDLILYWVHNSQDGSKQYSAKLEMYINGVKHEYELQDAEIDNAIFKYTPLSDKDKEEGKTNTVYIKTEPYVEGTKIEWRICTMGITKVYGEWSIQRVIDIYAPPSLSLEITDSNANQLETITSFPFYIIGTAGPATQAPIGYHLVIKSNSIYVTTDSLGNERTVNVGEEVYSQYFDTFEVMRVELLANSVDLENNISYTVTCTVSMDSGLTTEASKEFTVAWTDMEHEPNAEISIDKDTLTAYIRPYCEDGKIVCYTVNDDSGVYTVGSELQDTVYGEPYRACREVILRGGIYVIGTADLFGLVIGDLMPGVKTITGEKVYLGTNVETEETVYYCYPDDTPAITVTGEEVYRGSTSDGTDIYYCYVDVRTPVNNVYLSVYRREFDGSFKEIASGLDGANNTTVTDPHPSLDLARYRIVAITKDTGAVSYFDTPGYPVGGKSAIIQWDEAWTSFESTEEAALEQPPWAGSLLNLPYNIDVSDNSNPDVARIEYIGREHPITYYGTQLGHTSSWSMEIPKSDKETLYALRRLQRWMNDVYVREPSGSGYWANITVSFSQKHCETTIPVTLSIVRVEGGV